MSASQEKKKRIDEKSTEGMTRRELDEYNAAKKRKKHNTWTIIIVCLCVLVSAAALLYNGGVVYRLPAVEIKSSITTTFQPFSARPSMVLVRP